MHFIHPEILYFLFLLIIPILVHLFQLQRFEKVVFTNVQLLKKIEQQTRKSSRLKKFLILLSRLLLLACLILAFAQPYSKLENTSIQKNTVIYIDNSFSMQAKAENGTLLDDVKINLMETLQQQDDKITLISNNQFLKDLTVSDVKKEIIKMEYTSKRKDLKTLFLQLEQNKNPQNLFLVSDFQRNNSNFENLTLDSLSTYNFIQLTPKNIKDVFVDSMWIKSSDRKNTTLNFKVKSATNTNNNIALSLFINHALAGKTTVDFSANTKKDISFTIPFQETFEGYLQVEDSYLPFNNQFYFVKNKSKKTKVLVVGKEAAFFNKIYSQEEFILKQLSLEQLNFKDIFKYNLLILNEINQYSKPFTHTLNNYLNQNGKVVIIPSINANLSSYQNLFRILQLGNFKDLNHQPKRITKIAYEHPFFKNVFDKKIDNFQYPSVKKSYDTNLLNSSTLLQFEDQSDFISSIQKKNGTLFWVASSLEERNSNFINSSLVVPVFYNFSLENSSPKTWYYYLGKQNSLYLKYENESQEVVHIKKDAIDFIPLQQKRAKGIYIELQEQPEKNGIYTITLNNQTLQKIAFNHNKLESDLTYYPVKDWTQKGKNMQYYNNVKAAFQNFYQVNKKNNLWQLFIIFALIFLGAEVLLQKFLKN